MCGVRKIRILTKEVALMVPGLQTEEMCTRSHNGFKSYEISAVVRAVCARVTGAVITVPGFEDESITSTIPPPPEIEAPSLPPPPPPP
ncbi:hypothetical protein F2Q70_00035570 [Brassica cretica]|uniref:Uncharacterized protein n=1 Tax=Brassica cretica TaxID=69181 RepID=A0A8S9JPJ5_BRACR|nr:hypothetical protein F2Q68_00030800 [Brassica cretica]KAF2584065.1 hypothetical protein F2Q70_00035570 [Brassica cretica]KAF3598767.1 hypothetical protein F2Q69_00034825 [Brassica cretica]